MSERFYTALLCSETYCTASPLFILTHFCYVPAKMRAVMTGGTKSTAVKFSVKLLSNYDSESKVTLFLLPNFQYTKHHYSKIVFTCCLRTSTNLRKMPCICIYLHFSLCRIKFCLHQLHTCEEGQVQAQIVWRAFYF